MSKGGTQRITADGVIGISGQPVRMYGAVIDSGATAANVIFRDGTSASATAIIDAVGTASRSIPIPDMPAEGILFPSGLFVDVDANTDAVTVAYEQVIAR
jgi:hypothetical protein